MRDRRYSIHVTHADCTFTFTKGGGPGGQNVNKRNTKCRCVHKASGAWGMSFDERSQEQNKKTAFMRMAATEAFRRWAHLETARVSGRLAEMEETVRRAMLPKNLQLEVKDAAGRWMSVPLNAPLDDDTVA
jgi:protein subunit release factor B